MEALLALVALGLAAALWSRIGRQKRELEKWRNELWGVQRAGAHLEHRVMQLEAWGTRGTWAENVPWQGELSPAPATHGNELPAPSWAEAEPHAEAQAEPPAEAEAEPDAEAEAEPPAEPEADAEPEVDGEPEADAEPEVDANADADAATPSDHTADSNDVWDAYLSPPATREVPEPRTGQRPISLEQWLGVRGAAALGAAVLVLAGIFFFKYSIENELLTTTMRVALGAAAGMSAALGAELWLRKRHELLANCLTGAAMAIFYLTFWAAFARYALIGAGVAGALMVLTTVASCAMAIKRSSHAIAALGLVGGFATPLMLSTGSDRPIALFSYLLLLDAALLLVAYKRRWPGLALLSLLGTSAYQALWMVGRMGPERLGFGIALSGVFAAMFSFAGHRQREEGNTGELWQLTRGAALAIPMALALLLCIDVTLEARFTHVALLLVGVIGGAASVARQNAWPRFLKAALFPTLCVIGAWMFLHGVSDAWLIGGFTVGVALLLQAIAELGDDATGNDADGSFGWIIGAQFVTVCGVVYHADAVVPWPWLVTWLVLALVGLRHGSAPGREWASLGTSTVFGVGVLLLGAVHLRGAATIDAEIFVGIATAVAVLYQLATLLVSFPEARRTSAHAAAVLPVTMMLMLPIAESMRPGVFAIASLALLALTAMASLRHHKSAWLLAGTVLAGLAQFWRWSLEDVGVASAPWGGATNEVHVVSWFAHGAVVLLVCAFPLLANDRVRNTLATWRTAALAPVLMFLPMLCLQRRLWGQSSTALLAIGLGTVTLLALFASRTRGAEDADVRRSASAWLGGVTLAFATAAIPLALEHEWVTIGWALLATALIALWRRIDHTGLKYVALALNTVVFLRLLAVFEVAGFHATVGPPILNWMAYTYLVPIGCLLASILMLRDVEPTRLRAWEPVRGDGRPITSNVLGAAAIVLGFVWLNLVIVDLFSTTAALDLDLERMPARDLTMSICWAVYGLALLGTGMWRKAGALRKASLGLIVVTCGKVFLFDLAHLRDLYRVMSLTGLALSLIAVSFAYNRFVFRREDA